MSPREIAEKIVNNEALFASIGAKVNSDALDLARAYLELEKKIMIQKPSPSSVHQAQYYIDIICGLKDEITKLKKSRVVLRSACEFYGNWVNSPDGIIHRSDCETIFVHEPLEKDKNGIIVAGKKAREVIKADDELMGDDK